jgi:anti-sigma28 factor (negative regulator of flagellin synthesis)
MRISDNEVKKLLSGHVVVQETTQVEEDAVQADDTELIAKLTADVMAAGDREEMVADLRARIEAGTYNPTADEIADTMIRRAIADRVRAE